VRSEAHCLRPSMQRASTLKSRCLMARLRSFVVLSYCSRKLRLGTEQYQARVVKMRWERMTSCIAEAVVVVQHCIAEAVVAVQRCIAEAVVVVQRCIAEEVVAPVRRCID
jgi:hypothetical protein